MWQRAQAEETGESRSPQFCGPPQAAGPGAATATGNWTTGSGSVATGTGGAAVPVTAAPRRGVNSGRNVLRTNSALSAPVGRHLEVWDFAHLY